MAKRGVWAPTCVKYPIGHIVAWRLLSTWYGPYWWGYGMSMHVYRFDKILINVAIITIDMPCIINWYVRYLEMDGVILKYAYLCPHTSDHMSIYQSLLVDMSPHVGWYGQNLSKFYVISSACPLPRLLTHQTMNIP